MSASALADGKVFLRLGSVATIPDQAALIYWEDGVQTLAIETRFVGQARRGGAFVAVACQRAPLESLVLCRLGLHCAAPDQPSRLLAADGRHIVEPIPGVDPPARSR